MTDAATFASILEQKPEEAEKPKPFPGGSYLSVVMAHEFGTSSKKKTPYVEFTVRHMSPGDDVDIDALNLVKKWQERKIRLTFYLTEDAMWRLRDFADHCGVNYTGRTWAEVIPEFTATQFLSIMEQSVDEEDPTKVYSNITQTAVAA